MGCGTITIGSDPNCTTPLKAGTRPRLLLANYSDIVSVTLSAATPNLITAITFASNTVFHVFNGFKQDVKPTQEIIAPSNGANQLKHNLNFVVYEISQLQKNNLQRLIKSEGLVAICENKGKDANSFEVYGLGSGMQIVPGVARDTNANGGGYIISLATLEGEFEPLLPQTIFVTDYAATLALVEGYAALPTITNITDQAISTAGGDAETITGTYFYGGGASSAVVSMKWVNQVTGAEVSQTGLTVASNTSITFSSVALTTGTYKLRITTTRGTADSALVVIVS